MNKTNSTDEGETIELETFSAGDKDAAREFVKEVLIREADEEGFGTQADLSVLEESIVPPKVTEEDKRLRDALLDRGFKEHELPKALRDITSKASKKGKFGAIIVKRFSGIQDNAARKVINKFLKNIGGRDALIHKLTAVEDRLNDEEKTLLKLLKEGSGKPLTLLIAESGVNPARVVDNYAKGAIALGKLDAAIKAAENMPKMVNDLLRHALDKEDVCQRCVGVGRVPRKAETGMVDSVPCKACKGSGKRVTSSKHKTWAADKILQIGGVVEEKGGPTVNVGVNVDASGGSFMGRVLDATDAVLYENRQARRDQSQVIDVEAKVVSPEVDDFASIESSE